MIDRLLVRDAMWIMSRTSNIIFIMEDHGNRVGSTEYGLRRALSRRGTEYFFASTRRRVYFGADPSMPWMWQYPFPSSRAAISHSDTHLDSEPHTANAGPAMNITVKHALLITGRPQGVGTSGSEARRQS